MQYFRKGGEKGLILGKTFWLFRIVLEDFAVCRHRLLSNRLIVAGKSIFPEQKAQHPTLPAPIQEMLLGSYISINYGGLDAVNYSRENSDHKSACLTPPSAFQKNHMGITID